MGCRHCEHKAIGKQLRRAHRTGTDKFYLKHFVGIIKY